MPDWLVRLGILERADGAFQKIGDATIRMVRLSVSEEELSEVVSVLRCTEKQKRVLKLLVVGHLIKKSAITVQWPGGDNA